MPEEIAVLLLTIAMGVFGLTGLRMFLNYRVKRFAQMGGDEARRLEESVTSLRDEFFLLRNDMTDLQERVEFAERLLARARDAEPRKLPGSP
jgi:hypothetical protein